MIAMKINLNKFNLGILLSVIALQVSCSEAKQTGSSATKKPTPAKTQNSEPPAGNGIGEPSPGGTGNDPTTGGPVPPVETLETEGGSANGIVNLLAVPNFTSMQTTKESSRSSVGTATLYFNTIKLGTGQTVTAVRGKVLSSDFKIETATYSPPTATGVNEFEQKGEIFIKFKFVPDNVTKYESQSVVFTVTDSITKKTSEIERRVDLYLCKAGTQNCGSGAPINSTISGAAGHPQAVGTL